MPTVDEMYPSKSNHLKATDLKGQQHKLTVESYEAVKFDDSTKIVIKFIGRDKTFVVNKTNARVMGEYFGNDIDDWMGKEVVLYPDKVDFQGKLVDAIRVRIDAPMAADADMDDDVPF